MRGFAGLAGMALLTVVAATPGWAQTGCENGIVRLPAGVSGAITICPAVASQAPDLVRQLAQIQSAMSSEQAQLAQLTRLVNAINQVSGPLGAKRQAELLTNVTTRLGDARTVSGAQFEQRASTLSGHFEDVSTEIGKAQSDPAEAAKTNAALEGEVGDAIARLDFDTVSNQLSDIQATVHSVDERTKQIQGTLDTMQNEYQQSQQAGQQAYANMQAQTLANPSQFLILRLAGFGQPGGPGKMIITLGHVGGGAGGSPLADAKMQVVFKLADGNPWVFTPPIPRFIEFNSSLTTDVPRMGDHAVVCVSAVDPRTSERRRWREAFAITSQASMGMPDVSSNPRLQARMAQFAQLSFQPDSEATLTPDSDAPCQ
jgi:hypothetical protein